MNPYTGNLGFGSSISAPFVIRSTGGCDTVDPVSDTNSVDAALTELASGATATGTDGTTAVLGYDTDATGTPNFDCTLNTSVTTYDSVANIVFTVVTSVTTNISSINELAYGSISSVNEVSKASMASWNGVT